MKTFLVDECVRGGCKKENEKWGWIGLINGNDIYGFSLCMYTCRMNMGFCLKLTTMNKEIEWSLILYVCWVQHVAFTSCTMKDLNVTAIKKLSFIHDSRNPETGVLSRNKH